MACNQKLVTFNMRFITGNHWHDSFICGMSPSPLIWPGVATCHLLKSFAQGGVVMMLGHIRQRLTFIKWEIFFFLRWNVFSVLTSVWQQWRSFAASLSVMKLNNTEDRVENKCGWTIRLFVIMTQRSIIPMEQPIIPQGEAGAKQLPVPLISPFIPEDTH